MNVFCIFTEMSFIFRFSSGQSVLIEEGREVRLTVVRLQGSFREVHVSWNVSVDAFPDISPANGTLTFHNVSRYISQTCFLSIKFETY